MCVCVCLENCPLGDYSRLVFYSLVFLDSVQIHDIPQSLPFRAVLNSWIRLDLTLDRVFCRKSRKILLCVCGNLYMIDLL